MDPTQVLGRRIGAVLIDTLVIAAIIAGSWYVLTKNASSAPCTEGGLEIGGKCRGFTRSSSGDRTIWLLIVVLAPILINWVMQGLTGKTPGKAIVGIKTVNAEGRPPGIGHAALRSILAIVDGFPYFIPYLVGFIVALNSDRHQRIGDKAAGTYVVDKAAEGALAAPSSSGGLPQGGQPQGLQPADWYPDPQGQARLRYWDGQRWTEHTSA
jgi:uncharacterized RDD family membrane protein YckC